MVKSMTGFGRYELFENNKKICIEIKSVNHRYLDINLRLPRNFMMFESELRNIVKQFAARGKIDVFVNYEDLEGTDVRLNSNKALISQYLNTFECISEEFKVHNNITMSDLISLPEVITTEEIQDNVEEQRLLLAKSLTEASKNFVKTRAEEGLRLKSDIELKIENIRNNVQIIVSKSPQLVEEYRINLENKMKELLEKTDIDESRIVMETVVFADKSSLDEELVRLSSHIEQVKQTLVLDTDIGRKLDFIAQEMNREANTILSKSSDLEVSNIAIELKTDIEKIREQVQNIE